MEWIKCSQRLPEKNGTYWVFPTHHKEKYCALYWDGKEFSSGKYRTNGITHYKEMILQKPIVPED